VTTPQPYDVAAVRAQFPALTEGAAHFDGPGGTQVPVHVAQAVASTLTSAISNRSPLTASSRRADQVIQDCREAMADLLDTTPTQVVFGRSATQLTYGVARALSREWGPGDEVVVTRLDHDANIRPWVHAAEAAGATVRWAGFDRETGELRIDHLLDVLGGRTRLVAVTGASNLLGTRPDLETITAAAHEAGALVCVDAVHLAPHAVISLQSMGADLLTCSPYKFLGPHCGVLTGDLQLLERLHPDKLLPSSAAVPERFELGTLPYELMAGTTAAVDVLADLAPGAAAAGTRRERLVASLTAIAAHEDALVERLDDGLDQLAGVTTYGRARHRAPTRLFSVDGRPSQEVAEALAADGVNAPAGSFYALEASRWLGLGDAGAVRAGMAPYTDDSDVDRLLAVLKRLC